MSGSAGSRRRLGWSTLALGLLLAGLAHGAFRVPALFDGLILPDVPYNYCHPPANLASSNTPPQSGQAAFPVLGGKVAGGGVQTGDSQVVVFFGLGALEVSAGATSVSVTVDPVCNHPPSPPPGLGIHGNVYRIAATEQPGGQLARLTATYNVTMRYPPGPSPQLQFFDGSTWHPLKTALAGGNNLYAGAAPTALGEIAATAPANAGGDSILTILARNLASFGILALVIVFGIIAVIQEIRRRRTRA
jgi:hypothetical protein